MNINGKHYRTIWHDSHECTTVQIINQQKLPHEFEILELTSLNDAVRAIKDMYVRGAGLIGATAGYGMYLATFDAPLSTNEDFTSYMQNAGKTLISTRPTAKNLEWAVHRVLKEMERAHTPEDKKRLSFTTAVDIADEDAEFCRRIGVHGFEIIKDIYNKKEKETVNILTHCNAGWLAFVDYGSALAPVYEAFERGVQVHVYVDETRPRNQGASLTAWELANHGVPHTLIADNTGGHLMQHGMVDMVITGADRVTKSGDAANKIGTYLKALAAHDNNVPFYVALPSSTFDWDISDGIREIEIETRSEDEVRYIQGSDDGKLTRVLLCPQETKALNYGFDVTPSWLITGLITERGVVKPDSALIRELYSDITF
jgi:methylthioribose-1-phosphate isomerase